MIKVSLKLNSPPLNGAVTDFRFEAINITLLRE